LAAGMYSWMPLGLRALRKVEKIVREEMNRAGALELLMPGVIPAELWVESGRWEQYGPELLRMKDRHERDFCLGPTHEEVIADTGAIGGSASEEFHVLADSGEDAIAFSDGDNYAANLEMAVAMPPTAPRQPASASMTEVATPNARTIEDVSRQLKLPASRLV